MQFERVFGLYKDTQWPGPTFYPSETSLAPIRRAGGIESLVGLVHTRTMNHEQGHAKWTPHLHHHAPSFPSQKLIQDLSVR